MDIPSYFMARKPVSSTLSQSGARVSYTQTSHLSPPAQNQSDVFFGQKNSNSGAGKSHRLRQGAAAALLAGLSAIAAAPAASAQGATAPQSSASADYDHSHDLPASYGGPKSTNDCGHVPDLDQQMRQIMVDLKQNPLITSAARAQVENALQQFYNSGDGEMKLVVLPDISNGVDIQDCAYELFNQLRLGKQGINDGLLVLINANNFRNGKPHVLAIETGASYEKPFTNNNNLHVKVSNQVISLITKAYQAKQDGNLSQAQEYSDQAVEKAVSIFIEQAKDYHKDHAFITDAQQKEKARQAAQQKQEIIQDLLIALAALCFVGGATTVGVKTHNRNKRLDADIAIINPVLDAIGSNYLATRRNVHSLNTLNALLSNATAQQNPERSQQQGPNILKAADTVIAGMMGKNPEGRPAVLNAFIDNALLEDQLHPSVDVRQRAVGMILEDGVTADDYPYLLTLAQHETNPAILTRITKPMVQMATPDDLNRFILLLEAETPETRIIAVKVMKKLANRDTLNDFLNRLQTEQNVDVIEALQEGIASIVKPEDANRLTALLQDQNPNIKDAAILGLGSLGENNPAHFNLLYQTFQQDRSTSGSRLTAYQTALGKAVKPEHRETLFNALRADRKEQAMALGLLGQIRLPAAVEPLLDYLASNQVSFPQEAGTALAQSANRDSRPVLSNVLAQTDRRGRIAAVRQATVGAMSQVNDPDDLPAFITTLERESDPGVNRALRSAILNSPTKDSSFAILTGILEDSNKRETLWSAVAPAIQRYGITALPVLFVALKHTGHSSQDESPTTALQHAIQDLSKTDSALDELLKQSKSGHPLVRTVATKGSLSILNGWSNRYNYDSPNIMTRLATLSEHSNSEIKQKAAEIRRSFINRKTTEIQRIGSSGNVYTHSNRTTLQSYRNDPILAAAATAALIQFTSRYDAAESQRRAEEARQAEAARQASMGYSGGGGIPSGGGDNW